jgi:septum formation inhibitor-activating ATPase MinD
MMLLMMAADQQRAIEENMPCYDKWLNDELLQRIAADEVAIILTANGIEAHWMLAVDVADNHLVLVDPYPSDTYDMQKIIRWPVKQIDKLTRYGQHKSRAIIFLKKEQ